MSKDDICPQIHEYTNMTIYDQAVKDWQDKRIKKLEAENAELRERLAESYVIIKAVAHIGIDWGYGKYEIEQHHIDNARKIYEDLIKQITGDL